MDRVPAGPAVHQGQIEAISEEWVSDKSLPEMGFTLGGINELDDDNVRCLIAIDGDRTIHGVTSWMPSYRHGAVVGWTLDFMRRRSSKGEVSTVFQGAADAGSMWWLPVLLFLLTVVPAGICAAKGQACHRRPRHRVPTHRPDRRGPARQTRIVVGPPGLRSDLAPPKPRRTALRRELPRSLGTAA